MADANSVGMVTVTLVSGRSVVQELCLRLRDGPVLALLFEFGVGHDVDTQLFGHLFPLARPDEFVGVNLLVEHDRQTDRVEIAQSVEDDSAESDSSPESGLDADGGCCGRDVGSTCVATAASSAFEASTSRSSHVRRSLT